MRLNLSLFLNQPLHTFTPSSLSPHPSSSSSLSYYPKTNPHLSSSSERINPSTKSIPSLRNLDLNNRFRPGVIAPTQFLSRLIGLEHILAVIRVGVLRPLKRTRGLYGAVSWMYLSHIRAACEKDIQTYRRININTTHPPRLLRRIHPGIDRSLQPRRKRQQDGRGIPAPGIVLHHLRVPGRMQIRRLSLPRHGDLVPAQGFRLVVQRLRDVADEMDQELEGLLAVREGAAAVVDALGLATSVSFGSFCSSYNTRPIPVYPQRRISTISRRE